MITRIVLTSLFAAKQRALRTRPHTKVAVTRGSALCSQTFIFALAFAITFTFDLNPAHAKNSPPDETTQYLMKFKAKNKFERSKVADLGFEIESMVGDSVMVIGQKEDLENAKRSKLLTSYFTLDSKLKDFPDYDTDFHSYNELREAMQTLASENPDLVKFTSAGSSREGRDLMLLTITAGADQNTKPALFFMGGHHAREHISVETPLMLAKYLAEQYRANNSRVVRILNSRTIYILPLVNPDGAEYDVASGAYRLWRKNRHNNGESFGVDLNRNYGHMWGGGGASSNPRSDVYRGTSAFSEPETQAIKNFFETHENISINLSFHTFSELILYPWGHKYEKIENQNDYLVHKTMAETMAQWNGYTPVQSSELYITSGDTTDWAYGALGLISFTFELDPKGGGFNPEKGFYPGQDKIQTTFQKNVEPCLYLMEYADNPYRVMQTTSQKYGLNSPILE